jgi:hypothetical protein
MAITVGGTNITFSDATTQTTAGITSAVTSAVAGNGVSVSAATGAVTFAAAAPTFNTVGSYCAVGANGGTFASGSNYAAGPNPSQLLSGNSYQTQNNLSGTWKFMAAGGSVPGCPDPKLGIAVRVS